MAADAGEDTPVYENTANDYQVEIPSEFQEGQGITISRDGYQVKLIPVSGDYSKSVQKENMIRYNEVFPHIDVQYTVLDDCVKEDIILYEPDTRVYQYELLAEGLIPSQPQEGGGILLSDEAGEPIFLLEAPMMEDAAGEVGTGLTMGLEVLEGKAIVTVTPDAQWLTDAARSYPVRIDPAHTYLNGSDPELYCVAEGLPDTVLGGTTTPYVGYDDGSLTHRTANGETPYLSSRIYVDLAYDLTLPAENAEVSNAKLQFCQMTNYSHGEMKINLYAVEEDWDAASLTWNSQPGCGERLGAADACGVNGEWLTFDITAYITKLINGESASHGLLLDADNERRYCEAIYNRNSSYGPSLIVEWQEGEPKDPEQPENPDQPEDDPALKEYPLADLTLQLRPIMEAAGGRVTLLGVFADGLASAHAKVTWQLSGQQGISTTEAAGQYKFPDSTEFEALFPTGTKYKGQESNWQTGLFEGLTYDTVYTLLAAAEKDGTSSGQKTSDSFLIYRVQQNDTLPRIAAHYGVSLETMKRDNGIKSALVGKGSTLFIRNPKTSEPYSRGELSDSEKAEIDRALMGQGLHCEFGFEPVNLNTGNFYLESQDAVLNDLSGAFAITRVYNSKGAGDNSIFGKGWGFEYEESLALAEEGVISYRRGDGSSLLLTKGEDGCYYAPEGYEYTLREVSSIDEAGEPAVSRYELTDSSQMVRGFDGYGLLSDITDRQGHVTSLTYDENFCLSSITSPSGKVYGITCGEEGRITAILLPNGAVLSYTYDEAGNLISYTDACGGVITYEYDSQGRMVSWHDQNGIRVIQNGYDSQGRVTEQTDANGNTAYFRYGDHTTTTVDNLGYETVYRYDDQYRTFP